MKLKGKKEMSQRVSNNSTLTAIDIFAGGGGLTVGLKRAGFNVVAAVEIEAHAFSTYKANHPEVHAYKQDISTVKGERLLAHSPTGKIDLLAGCPPCQGFTSLARKYRRSDLRNKLILEMGRLVEEIQPRTVMMENVPGLLTEGESMFEAFVEKLTNLGYGLTWKVLQVADYGIPQNRRRLVFFASKDLAIEFPNPTHSQTGDNGLPTWKTLKDVINGMPKPLNLKEANLQGGPQKFNWHVVRKLSAKNIARLIASKPGEVRTQLSKELRPKRHQNLEKGFGNVYGRMRWDQTSVTITTGCTTLSTGRFGHPEEIRTISVREAAMIQTFPNDYIIDTPYIDYACGIVGNALPCDFAEIVARQCAKAVLTTSPY
jgi:DNA (cytosine-5)-methyltransferase 1